MNGMMVSSMHGMNMSSHDHMNMSGHDHMNMSGHDMNTSGTHDMNSSMHHMTGAAMGHEAGSGHGDMYFQFVLPVRVLFFGWNITTQEQLAGSCIGVFIISLLYEGLKLLRKYLLKISSPKRSPEQDEKNSESSFNHNKRDL
ncbi:uncharacterized protein LOC100178573 isoform X2 [Ciona intestinalis]